MGRLSALDLGTFRVSFAIAIINIQRCLSFTKQKYKKIPIIFS